MKGIRLRGRYRDKVRAVHETENWWSVLELIDGSASPPENPPPPFPFFIIALEKRRRSPPPRVANFSPIVIRVTVNIQREVVRGEFAGTRFPRRRRRHRQPSAIERRRPTIVVPPRLLARLASPRAQVARP